MLLPVLILVMLTLDLKIGAFFRLSGVKKEFKLRENYFEIMIK